MNALDSFIWIGQHIVNLNRVTRFLVEDDEKRIVVFLQGASADDAQITIDGPDAEHLMETLRDIKAGKTYKAPVFPVIDMEFGDLTGEQLEALRITAEERVKSGARISSAEIHEIIESAASDSDSSR